MSERKTLAKALIAFAGIAAMEWFLGWTIWMQLEWWTLVRNTTYTHLLFFLIASTFFAVCLGVVIKTYGTRNVEEQNITVEPKKPKKKSNMELKEEARLKMVKAEDPEPEAPNTTDTPKQNFSDTDLEQAEKAVKIAILRKKAEKIASGEIDVTLTEQDYNELGLIKPEKAILPNHASGGKIKFTGPSKEDLKELRNDKDVKKLVVRE